MTPTTAWETTPPGTVTWVAWLIPRLRSGFFDETPPQDPSAVTVDMTVLVDDIGTDVCADSVVDNTATMQAYSYTPLNGSVQLVPGTGPLSLSLGIGPNLFAQADVQRDFDGEKPADRVERHEERRVEAETARTRGGLAGDLG